MSWGFMMYIKWRRYTLGLISFFIISSALIGRPIEASELTYTPINPSFGGNPFNSPHLIRLAELQNQHRDDDRSRITGRTGLNQGDLFVRSLSSRLLSALAGQVTDAIFGETPQESGTIVFGDVTVEFERGLEFVSLTITDAASGSVTDVRVPILQGTP